MNLKIVGIAFYFLTLGACASLPADDFAKVKAGMEKDEVLSLMGEPSGKVSETLP